MFATKLTSILFVTTALLSVVHAAPWIHERSDAAAGDPTYTYNGQDGPLFWGTLVYQNKTNFCSSGKQQSPINLDDHLLKYEHIDFTLGTSSSGLTLCNKGLTLQVDFTPEESAKYKFSKYGSVYSLAQYHVHTPSEHRYLGAYHDLELHLVWKDEHEQLAVTGVFFDKSETGSAFLEASFVTPQPRPVKKDNSAPVNFGNPSVLKSFLEDYTHAFTNYFAYDGSLTTPPCTEGVKWHVYRDVLPISLAQHKAITDIIPFNARETQPHGFSKSTYESVCSH